MGFSDTLAEHWSQGHGLLSDSVTYTPGVGAAVAVDGIFDAVYQSIDLGMAGISAPGPAVFFQLADLPSDPEADPDARITYASTTYRAHRIEKDGFGGVTLHLHVS